MKKSRHPAFQCAAVSTLLTFLIGLFGGCVSSSQALEMEKRVNCAIMKNLLDKDEDIFQVEDGTGAVGEATACPT
jgi:hypothetical protein